MNSKQPEVTGQLKQRRKIGGGGKHIQPRLISPKSAQRLNREPQQLGLHIVLNPGLLNKPQFLGSENMLNPYRHVLYSWLWRPPWGVDAPLSKSTRLKSYFIS